MKPIRILVVDDSLFAREVIVGLLSEDSEIDIVGQAENGREAVEMAMALKPDIITMDIEMPEMDGLEATEQIMSSYAVPILVVTSKGDANTAYTAISKGALEVLPKPEVDPDNPEEFINKIKLLSRVKVIPHILGKQEEKTGIDTFKKAVSDSPNRVVAIAASTGGPKALSGLLSSLPENYPLPIIIAQHIPPEFVSGMAEWLNDVSKLTIKRGEEGETLYAGNVYLSPSQKHMTINYKKEITLAEKQPTDIYSPSCDALLSSAAKIYGSKAIGVILTGMGRDGVEGIRQIKAAGGKTIAQDENSSVVFGMPKVAIENNLIDLVLPLNEISGILMNFAKNKG